MKRDFGLAVGCLVNLESATDRVLQVLVVQGCSIAANSRPDLSAWPRKLLAVGDKTVERNQDDMTLVFEYPVHRVRNRAAARMANNVRLVSTGGSDCREHSIVLAPFGEGADGAVCILSRAG